MPAESATAPPPTKAKPAKAKPAKSPAKPRSQTNTKPKRQPPYAVILHNDDLNGMDFVIRQLQATFGYGKNISLNLMLTAHLTGKCNVWSSMREHAEFKAQRLVSAGPDPMMSHKDAQPLRVTIEPLPD